MAIPYHEIKILSQKVMDAALKSYPEHSKMLRRADSYFEDGAHKHAIVHLIVQNNIDSALEIIMKERDFDRNQARAAITNAIQNAPRGWRDDKEFLHDNAIEKVGTRYFILPSELRKDTPFDTARKTLPAGAAAVLEAALKATLTRTKLDGISCGPITLDFIAAQLMSEGPEKQFRFDALLTTKPQGYDNQLTNSARAVRHFAAETGVDFAGLKIALREGPPPKRPTQEKEPTLPALTKTHNQAQTPLSLVHSEPLSDATKSLRDQLKRCIDDESITRQDALVYFHMFSMVKGEWPTYESAAEKFDIAVEDVAEIVESVGKILNAQVAPVPEKHTLRR